jgi:Zn-dependent peptidase ImmA (M78 family)
VAKSAEALINPELLVWARQSAGMQLEEAASRLRLPTERLHAWEDGSQRPTVKQLRKVAWLYQQSFAAFYLPKAPAVFRAPIRDYRRLPEQREQLISPDLALDIRLALDRREVCCELLAAQDASAKEFPRKVPVTRNPESVGAELRELLNITIAEQQSWRSERVAFNCWRTAIERLDTLVFQATTVPLEEMRAYSVARFPLPLIVVNRKDAYAGRVFSMLHELTHLLLRSGGVCDLDSRGGRPPAEQRTEVFCNHVAGACLVPTNDLLGQPMVAQHQGEIWRDDELAGLGRRYRVSREVVLRRLVILKLASAAFYEQKRIEFQQQYQRRRQEKGFVHPSVNVVSAAGRPFVRLVLDAFYEDRITASDVSDYLGVRLKHLERIAETVGMG